MNRKDIKPLFKLADFAVVAALLIMVVVIYSGSTDNFTDSAGVSLIRGGWKLGLCILASYAGYWIFRRALEPELRLAGLLKRFDEIRRELNRLSSSNSSIDMQTEDKDFKLRSLLDERKELTWLMIIVIFGRALIMSLLPLGVALVV